jgi:hypothetical protein
MKDANTAREALVKIARLAKARYSASNSGVHATAKGLDMILAAAMDALEIENEDDVVGLYYDEYEDVK